MKKSVTVGLGSFLSFVAVLAFSTLGRPQGPPSEQSPASQPVSSPTPCPEPDRFPRLIDDTYVTKFNGRRVNLHYDTGVMEGHIPWAVDDAKVTPLKDGGLLISLGDSIYRLNRQQHVVWRQSTFQAFIDYAYVESTDLIYATAYDNNMFIFNAKTGKEEFSNSRNGSAAYGAAEKYGDDMCLITDNFVMYREKFRGGKLDPMNDGITCWRGTKILWHLDFPPDADVVVNGKRILAVTKTKKAIYINEIVPPQTKSE